MAAVAVVWDFDGTIVDTESVEHRGAAAVYADHGLELTEQMWAAVVGSVDSHWLDRLERDLGHPVDRSAAVALRSSVVRDLLRTLEPLPGVVELLDDLRGVPMAIASNSPRSWVDRLAAQVGLADRFETIVSIDDVHAGKPQPDIYRLAVERLGVDAQHTVAIEDSITGVTAAVGAGLAVLAVPSGIARFHDVSIATRVVPTLAGVSAADVHALVGP